MMEWSQQYQQLKYDAQDMTQKPDSLSFFARRTYVPRPLSEATEIFDTDAEDDSLESPEDDDSQSTLSSRDELPTPPHTGGLGGFEFHFDDKCVVGPQGPHLFRSTPDILTQPEDDVFLGMSPVPQTPATELSKTIPKPIDSLTSAVAELDESQVRDWTPRQVAEWMTEAGFESTVVEKFLIHDISGTVLIDLQFEDLKELDISSFGKRHRVMSSIQQLRNSSMISVESSPISRTPSRSPRSMHRPARASEYQVVLPARSRSRRSPRQSEPITPSESVSIVGIEQVLPKEHKCSKGEDCPKWQKQQRKILRMQRAFEEEANRPISALPSEAGAAPSVVGSSDVLGPTFVKITPETLSGVQPRDPQESVRQFLNFQHIHNVSHSPSPPPAASASYALKSPQLTEHLKGLPKLTIPVQVDSEEMPPRTPISALQQPTQIQAQLRAQLKADPYHYGGVASPADIYRLDTPMSAADIPVTALALDPCERDVSQSVPPEMCYGAPMSFTPDPVQRSASTQPSRRHRQPSFTPSVAPVRENHTHHVNRAPRRVTEIELANHQGWVRKRKTTRMLRHEWQDNYCTLVGSKLTMHDTQFANANELEDIDVDEYTLHAYSQATGSKLSAAFKKSLLGQGKLPAGEHSFAFTLIPEEKVTQNKRLFDPKVKSHHFAVDSSKERVEWMRKLMLAKAMKKNEGCQI